MASPLLLALSASAALIAGPALACEGQGCWGMAPAQELNPGYTGPDYSQFDGPQGPDGYADMGPGVMEPGDRGPGEMGPGDVGPDRSGYAGDDQRPYIGPIEGLADQQRSRAYGSSQAYGYGSQSAYGQGGYSQQQAYGSPDDDMGPVPPEGYGPGQDDHSAAVYGPPRDYSPAHRGSSAYGGQAYGAQSYGAQDYGQSAYAEPEEGEPASAYAMARPTSGYGYEPGPRDQAPYGQPMPGRDGARQVFAARSPSSPTPPYQTYSHHGFERSSHGPETATGYRSSSYRAKDVSEYNYDSGWVEDTGAMAYGRGRSGWSAQGSHDGPDGYGPAPCDQCSGDR